MGTLSTAAKNAALDALLALIDAGAGAGKLKIRTSADADLVVMTLVDPAAAASASGGVLTLDFSPPITQAASGTGTHAKFVLTDDADTIHYTGTTGTGGGELNFDGATITSGQNVTVNSLTVNL